MLRHLRFLLAAACLAAAPQLLAAVDGAPLTIDYQGRVLDANNLPLANTTPTNYEIKFRIYAAQEGGNPIWAERQTVTVDKGNFSVRLGEGQPIPAVGGTNEPRPSLAETFNNRDRYLGLTVVITGQPEGEISPRLAFLTSPYSFVAEKAKGVDAPPGTTSNLANATFNGTVAVATGNFNVTSGTISGSGSGLTSLNAANVASGTLNEARLSGNVALLNRSPQTFTGVNNFTNAIGIGQPSPSFPLHLTTASYVAGLFEGSNTVGTWLALRNTTATNRFWHLISTGSGNGGGAGKLLFATGPAASSTDATPMTMTPTAVGIGTLNPTTLLQVGEFGGGIDNYITVATDGGNTRRAGLRLQHFNVSNGYTIESDERSGTLGLNFLEQRGGALTSRMFIRAFDGNVGIGTTAPTDARLVVTGGVDKTGLIGGFLNVVGAGNSTTHGLHNISIKTSGTIWVGHTVIATSDERIKDIQGGSDGGADLQTLLGIKITDFTYRDTITKGNQPQKKVVAQQVEKVFPQAVSKHTDVVPDIYEKAAIRDGWVKLATDLKKGERVRLIGGKNEGIHEVLEVAAGRFRTDFATEGDVVFVYGREVKDFRTVDYEAISMLNVSATQQIKKEKDAEVKALQEENAGLRARLTALEAKDKARDAKLAAIEKALLPADKPAARPVSLKLGAGAE